MKTAIVTAGPTRERIDPVRYLTNDSSGKQGYAIAQSLLENGYEVTLISGKTGLTAPDGVKFIEVESAIQMLEACEAALPCDLAVCTAAVADWRPATAHQHKLKKREGEDTLTIEFVKNPDILKTISNHKNRPQIVVGFAAETENLIENAQKKLEQKNCDMILANNVGGEIFNSDENEITLLDKNGNEQQWPKMSKVEVANKLVGVLALGASS